MTVSLCAVSSPENQPILDFKFVFKIGYGSCGCAQKLQGRKRVSY